MPSFKSAFRIILLPLAAILAAASPFSSPVADEELGEMRGGFTLPNGVRVAIAVQSETVLNGNLVLRSTYVIAQGAPELSVFVPKTGVQVAAAGAGSDGTPAAGATFSYDRQNGLQVVPNQSGPVVSVTNGAPTAMVSSADADLERVDIAPGGSVVTASGTVSLSQQGSSDRVRLQTEGLDTNHFFGSGFGTLTANRSDDVFIDTATTVAIELGNVSAATIGSSLFRAENIALDSTRMLSRGGM